MSLFFKSICSSSKGNCVAIWTEKVCVLFDCGFSSMRRTRSELRGHLGSENKVNAVLVSHTHSDHIGHYPLRVIEALGCELYIHQGSIDQLKKRHYRHYGFADLKIAPFDQNAFEIGDLRFEPFEVSHNPAFRTFGYNVYYQAGDLTVKLAFATDLNQTHDCIERFVDCDFIYLEANHDLELLRKYYNPNSHYHLSNPKTAEFLTEVYTQSNSKPSTIVLGHLSEQRNTPQLVLEEIGSAFQQKSISHDIDFRVAPPRGNSPLIKIAD